MFGELARMVTRYVPVARPYVATPVAFCALIVRAVRLQVFSQRPLGEAGVSRLRHLHQLLELCEECHRLLMLLRAASCVLGWRQGGARVATLQHIACRAIGFERWRQ